MLQCMAQKTSEENDGTSSMEDYPPPLSSDKNNDI